MKGNVYTRQKCWICGAKLIHDERRGGCFCDEHPKVVADGQFYVKFGRDINKRFKLYQPAIRFLTGLRFKQDEGTYDPRDYQASNPLGFKTLAEQFVKSKEVLGLRSINNIRNYVARAIDYFDQQNIKTIKKGDIRRFLYSIEGISEKTRHNHMSCLHDFFYKFLVEDEEILNILEVPKFPDVPYELGYRNIVNLDDRERILETVREISWEVNPKVWFGIELLCAYTKIRPLDLIRLNEGDIDCEYGIMTFWRPTKKRNQKKVIRIRLIQEHVDIFSDLKAEHPGMPNMPFFRHIGGITGTLPDKPFGEKYFYKWWIRACKKLGIDGLDLYGGTRHSTTTALAKAVGKDGAKKYSGHDTNKAFDRYCQIEDEDTIDLARITVKLRKKGEVVRLKKAGSKQ